jgi:hypothetical protein
MYIIPILYFLPAPHGTSGARTDLRIKCNVSLAIQPDLKIQVCLVVEDRDYGDVNCLSSTQTR